MTSTLGVQVSRNGSFLVLLQCIFRHSTKPVLHRQSEEFSFLKPKETIFISFFSYFTCAGSQVSILLMGFNEQRAII